MDRHEYLGAPIVPEFNGDTRSALFIPGIVSADLDLDLDAILAAANRVLLRELISAETATVLAAQSGNPYFSIDVSVHGDFIGDGYFEDGCEYRPIWDWWPEFVPGPNLMGNDDDPADDLEEFEVGVVSWTDAMDYRLTAALAAPQILRAASERRTLGEFGAVDVILCLVAAHPSTPDSELRVLALDPNERVRELVLHNASASDETRVVAAIAH
jgi:hypothetical protein